MRNLWSILFCGPWEHPFENITYVICFWAQFHILKKLVYFRELILIVKKISPLNLVGFNSILNLLMILFFLPSCTFFYLTFFQKTKTTFSSFEFFFLKFTTQFFMIISFNSIELCKNTKSKIFKVLQSSHVRCKKTLFSLV